MLIKHSDVIRLRLDRVYLSNVEIDHVFKNVKEVSYKPSEKNLMDIKQGGKDPTSQLAQESRSISVSHLERNSIVQNRQEGVV